VEDNDDSFFEFSCFNDGTISTLISIELIATKSYSAGVVTTSIYFGGNWYLVVNDGNDDSKLVDTKFPSITTVEASGYNIQSYPSGIIGWPQLRSLTIWHSHREVDDTPGDECDVVSSVEDESAVIQSEQESDVARSRRWRDPWDKTVERGEIAVPVQNVEEKILDTLVPQEIIDVGDPVQKDDGDDVVDECTIPHGGDDDNNIADQLEISRLEESLENIGCDDDDSLDIGDTVNIEDITLDMNREEKNIKCPSITNTVVVEVCADTDDLYMQMEKLDRNLDRALQDLKEWEK
jgi:hypothetical protein